jgi:hypothetical protein
MSRAKSTNLLADDELIRELRKNGLFWEADNLAQALVDKSGSFRPNADLEYRGQHQAPSREDAPLWDLTRNGVYPADVYDLSTMRSYAIGDGSDANTWGIVRLYRDKPRSKVKIYRSVPMRMSMQEQIDQIDSEKRYILRHGKVPSGVRFLGTPSSYYEAISRKRDALVEKLETQGESQEPRLSINPGDWVTLDRRYAASHGESVLGKSNYKILSKSVPSSEVFTDGNSIMEWGWDPSADEVGSSRRKRA